MKNIKFILYLGIMLSALNLGVFGESTSLGDLFERVENFDGKEIEAYGEVIGSPLRADSGIWINILSDNKHLGIFIVDEKNLEGITHWGEYGQKGDFIKAKGAFNSDCLQHQTSDLHLSQIEVISRGFKVYDSVSPVKRNAGIALLLICLTMSLIYFIKERRRSKKRT